METKRLSERNYRKNHKNFGEVQRTTFTKGKILDFGVEKENPIILADTAKVELEGGGATNYVPIFYHCKEDFYIQECAELNADNGSLKCGAMAFEPDMEVKVMMHEASPVAIIGHADQTPRRCLDVIKFDLYGYAGVFTTQRGPKMTYHFRNSDQSLMCGMNQECLDPDGKDLNCTKKAIRLCGSREIQFGTVVYYMGDWLIELGPIFYLFMVYALGMPAPYTGQLWMSAAPASKELKDKTIEAGKVKETRLPDRLFSPMPPQEMYPEFVVQTQFTNSLSEFFLGWKPNSPRWVHSELYAQEWKL